MRWGTWRESNPRPPCCEGDTAAPAQSNKRQQKGVQKARCTRRHTAPCNRRHFLFSRVQQAEGGEELVLRRAAESEGRELQAGHEVRHAERGEEHGRDEEPRPAAGGTGTDTHTHTEFVCVHCIMHMVRFFFNNQTKTTKIISKENETINRILREVQNESGLSVFEYI